MPSLLGAGVFALVTQQANSIFEERSGYVIQDESGDIANLPAEVLDVRAAKDKCEKNPECQAISYSSSSSGPPKVFYKSSANNLYNDCWKSFNKVDGRYTQYDGFLPQGADDLSQANSEDEAKKTCMADAKCKGFSVRESTQVYYLKKTWAKPHHECWTTSVKVKQQGKGKDCSDGTCAAPREGGNAYGGGGNAYGGGGNAYGGGGNAYGGNAYGGGGNAYGGGGNAYGGGGNAYGGGGNANSVGGQTYGGGGGSAYGGGGSAHGGGGKASAYGGGGSAYGGGGKASSGGGSAYGGGGQTYGGGAKAYGGGGGDYGGGATANRGGGSAYGGGGQAYGGGGQAYGGGGSAYGGGGSAYGGGGSAYGGGGGGNAYGGGDAYGR